jgi:hypothetical protein
MRQVNNRPELFLKGNGVPNLRYCPGVHFEYIECVQNAGHSRKGKRLSETLEVELYEGKTLQDFNWTVGLDCIVSERVIAELAKFQLSGYATSKVRVNTGDNAARLGGYVQLLKTGWAGIVHEDSGIELISDPSCCGYLDYSPALRPRFVNWHTWDGSDLFMVWPIPTATFLSARALACFEANGHWTGYKLEVAEYFTGGLSMGFSPGRLSYWMPFELAHRLGSPLGIE